MKFLFLILFAQFIYATECPNLAGKYNCRSVHSSDGVKEYSLIVYQATINNFMNYIIKVDGYEDHIVADNKSKIEFEEQDSTYLRLTTEVTCEDSKLIIDVRKDVSRDIDFNFIFMKNIESTIYENKNGIFIGNTTGEVKYVYKYLYTIEEICNPIP